MSTHLVEPDDELLLRVRGGGSEAYDQLFERHAPRARRVARAALDDAADVDDVVSETFAAVFGALQRGTGPTAGFEGYLVSAVRHEAYRANRRRTKQRPLGDRGDEPADDPFAGREDEEILRAAFGSLPPVARDVLWRTEVEGHSHADIARSVGSTRQAIATRAARARDALGAAYLAGHLDLAFDQPPVTPQCLEVQRQLVDLVRGHASRRRRRFLEGHLDECARCRVGHDRLLRFNERLRTAPFMAAAAGATKLATVGGSASLLARLMASVSPVAGGAIAAATLTTTAVVAPLAMDEDVALAAAAPLSPASLPGGEHAEAAGRRSAGPSLADEILAAASGTPARTASASSTAADVAALPASPSSAASSSAVRPAASVPPVSVPHLAVPALDGPALSVTAPALSVPSLDVPAVTVPSLSVPTLTVPPVTVLPEVIIPAVAVLPALAVPAVTVPDVAVPSLAVPSISTPVVAVPALTTPSISIPPIATPAVTTPPVTTPAVTTPEIATPAITTPAVTTPEIATPEIATPAVTTPEIATPAVTTPAITTPVATVPAVTVPPLIP